MILNLKKRTGSVGLMLILILTLLVGTYAASVTRLATQERQAEIRHRSVAILQSAINAAAELEFRDGKTIRLPFDDESDRWVTVRLTQLPDSQQQYHATMYHNDRPGLSILRSVNDRDPDQSDQQ